MTSPMIMESAHAAGRKNFDGLTVTLWLLTTMVRRSSAVAANVRSISQKATRRMAAVTTAKMRNVSSLVRKMYQ